MTVNVRRLTAADAATYRELRLRMLRAHPDAFTSSYDEEERKPLTWVEQRLAARDQPASIVLGAFLPGEVLVGSVGLSAGEREKERHIGHLFGIFTAPEARNRGVGSALIEACLADAALIPGLEQVTLTVTEGNPAERLYAAAGFQRFGVEPRAIRVGDVYFGKVHMVLLLKGRLPPAG